MVKLYVSLDAELLGFWHDFQLELMLIIDQVRYVIVITAPRISNFLGRWRCHFLMLQPVVRVQNFSEFILHLLVDYVVLQGTLLYSIDELLLLFLVGFLLHVLRFEGLLKDAETVQHGEPLEASHEFVDHFADFVSISHTAQVYLDVIISDHTLRFQICVLYIKTAFTHLRFCVDSVLWDCLVEIIFLLQSLSSVHCVLKVVLYFCEQEHCIFACSFGHRRLHCVMGPALQHFIL